MRSLTTFRLVAGTILGVLVVLFLPTVVSDKFYVYTLTLGAIYLIGVLALNLVLSGGVISMGSAAFMMIGAYTVALGQTKWSLNPVLSTAIAVVLCALAGIITAFPALKLGAFAVAVVTLMYTEVTSGLVLRFQSFTGGGAGVSAKTLGFSSSAMWMLSAGVAAVVYVGHRNLLRSPMGRALMMGRRSEPVAASLGISTSRFKLASFSVYAAVTGLSGALYQMLNGVVGNETFDIAISITLLLMVVLGGEASVTGPLLGCAVLTIIPLVLNQAVSGGGATRDVTYGAMLLVVVLIVPGGLASVGLQVRRLYHRFAGRPEAGDVAADAGAAAPSAREAAVDFTLLAGVVAPIAEPNDLDVRDLSKAIGGLRILRGASFTVRGGTVHGLIGPNGSGKTTLLNCVSGLSRIDSGAVVLAGTPLPGVASRHARAGIGRTFQTALLSESASVRDNLLVGVDAHRRVSLLSYCLRLPSAWREARAAGAETERWAAALGLAPVIDRPVSSLTPRQRRLVEIGRALATHPTVILMDEPVAGLTGGEIDELVSIVRLLRTLGITVLLVEHHADLVMQLCDYVTVIDVGQILITDVPGTVSADPRVIAAYLGTELVDASSEPA